MTSGSMEKHLSIGFVVNIVKGPPASAYVHPLLFLNCIQFNMTAAVPHPVIQKQIDELLAKNVLSYLLTAY